MDNEEASKAFLNSSRFWIQKILVPLLVVVGVFGNASSVIVLTRKRMRCSTNTYLTALAVADIVYLLFVLILSFSHYDHIHERKYELYWRFFGISHWLCDAASSTSVWLTVSFTAERYLAISYPIKRKTICTDRRAKSVIVIVALICLLTTASTTFEYQLTLDEICVEMCSHNTSFDGTSIDNKINRQSSELSQQNSYMKNLFENLMKYSTISSNCSFIQNMLDTTNVQTESIPVNNRSVDNIPNDDSIIMMSNYKNLFTTSEYNDARGSVLSAVNISACCTKQYTIGTEYTNFGNNKSYKAIMYWFSALFFGIIPLILIATFNCFLIAAVYRFLQTRRTMTHARTSLSMNNEHRITVMLIGVVVLFLICQTPTAAFLIYNNFIESQTFYQKYILFALGNIFNFLITVNASCNFVMYCALSKKYRLTFKRLFTERRGRTSESLMLHSTVKRLSRYEQSGNALRRNVSEYRTPRNLETLSLTAIPRSKSLMVRIPGKATSEDMVL